MIVSSADDVVRLSGALVKNQWLTIKAAANLLLQNHPNGIIINCSELSHVAEEGAKTFLEAMRDIQAAGARIVVCCLPDNVLEVIRSVPTVRSQLPLATTEDEARASLRVCSASPAGDSTGSVALGGIVVPLLPGVDVDYAMVIASRMAREIKMPVHLVFLLEVARHLPLTSPLVEEEGAGQQMLAIGRQTAQRHGLQTATHIERVRDPVEGLLQLLRNYKAAHVVLCTEKEYAGLDRFQDLIDALLKRAPCGVLIGRKPSEAGNVFTPSQKGAAIEV